MSKRTDDQFSIFTDWVRQNKDRLPAGDTLKILQIYRAEKENDFNQLKEAFFADVIGHEGSGSENFPDYIKRTSDNEDSFDKKVKSIFPKSPEKQKNEIVISEGEKLPVGGNERFLRGLGLPAYLGEFRTLDKAISDIVDTSVRNGWVKEENKNAAIQDVKERITTGRELGKNRWSEGFVDFVERTIPSIGNEIAFEFDQKGVLASVFDKIKAINFSDLDDKQLSDYSNVVSFLSDKGIEGAKESNKTISDILADRGFVSEQRGQISALEKELPELQAKQRRDFYEEQRKQASQYLSGEFAPQVLQQLARRGLADSGEFGATVGAEFQSILGDIEQRELAQESEEINFWADQAYKTMLNDLIQAKIGVQQQVGEIRQDVLTTQQQNFQRSQADLQSRFALDLFRRENERALSNYRRQLETQESRLRKQREAGLFSDIAQAGATGIGLALTSKTGSNKTGVS